MHSRRIFIIIYVLTVIDFVFTYAGLQYGFISEANPFMAFLLPKFKLLTFAGVLAGVASALYFIYRVRARVKWLPGAMVLILAVKASVILLHLQWILNI
ncbi:MAG: hypothetical protein FIA99_03205 [Ruminiclostridium sp.]|nr:hypothetical protein [Ruminiclostridium sp.]